MKMKRFNVKVGDILMHDNELRIVEWTSPGRSFALAARIVNGDIIRRYLDIDEIEHNKHWLKVEI